MAVTLRCAMWILHASSWAVIVLSIALAVCVWWNAGLLRLHLHGATAEMLARGVIDEAALETEYGWKYVHQPSLVPSELLTGNTLYVLTIRLYAGCFIILIVGIFLTVLSGLLVRSLGSSDERRADTLQNERT